MRVLGIDPGTGITGFGVIDAIGGRFKLIDGGVIRTPANSTLWYRLVTIYDGVKAVIDDSRPEALSIEKLFFSQNVKTAISVSHARGVAMLAAAQAGLEVFEYTPLQIKQALTGYGRAEKSQIQDMVKVMLNLNQVPKPDDCADGLAAAICHAMHAGGKYPPV